MLKTSFQTSLLEAGCDEAGRGCLAGPVFAASVILPPDFHHPLLNDSKQMSARNRELLREIICCEAVAWNVSKVEAERIDEINILNASFEAMTIAVEHLSVKPEFLSIDGNRFKSKLNIPFKCIIKGDGTYANIAAASVLAKTFRDDYMVSISDDFPEYNWKKNKGYPTLDHRKAIERYGITSHHRRTFCQSYYIPSLFPLE